jgi:cysteine desulfurase
MQPPKRPLYLDNNATTPVDPRVLAAMMPYMTDVFGNAASRSHRFGWQAMHAVDHARASIAECIHAEAGDEIVFTSGATESINLALKGLLPRPGQDHIVTSQIEHKAVLDSCKHLEGKGVAVTYVPVDAHGLVNLDRLVDALTERTYLVSIMLANNEIGTIQDLAAIAELCRTKGIALHTDATQAVGKLAFDVRKLGVDMASFSAHKIYGPKGVGALYVNRRLHHRIVPQLDGGGHEHGLRSGTLNVPGIAGFAKALEICVEEQSSESIRIAAMRRKLFDLITSQLDGVSLHGHPTQCLPGTLYLSFAHADADSILLEMPDVALSSGSACTSANVAPSHVLKALGVSDELAKAGIRFSLGRFNAEADIEYVAERCVEAVSRLRSMSPLYGASTRLHA